MLQNVAQKLSTTPDVVLHVTVQSYQSQNCDKTHVIVSKKILVKDVSALSTSFVYIFTTNIQSVYHSL